MRSKLAFLSLGALLLASGLSAQTKAPKTVKKYPNLVAAPSTAKCAELIAAQGKHAKVAKARGVTKGKLSKNPKNGKHPKNAAAAKKRQALIKACKAVKRSRKGG